MGGHRSSLTREGGLRNECARPQRVAARVASPIRRRRDEAPAGHARAADTTSHDGRRRPAARRLGQPPAPGCLCVPSDRSSGGGAAHRRLGPDPRRPRVHARVVRGSATTMRSSLAQAPTSSDCPPRTARTSARFASDLHLPFGLASDAALRLTRAMRLPTFEIVGQVLLKRFTLVIRDGVVEHVFYPVFPPDRHAREVLRWLEAHPIEDRSP